MNNSQELFEKLTKDINKLQYKMEHRNLYNIRNFVVRALLKSGIALDYALPFLLSAIVLANAHSSKGNAPFHIDEIVEEANIETIDTSSGIHVEHISFDFNYDNEYIEYSTGWIINDRGLYERTVTSYRLNDEFDLGDTDKVMAMTKEEVDQALVITNIRTIMKNNLTPEDSIYNSDAIIVVQHSKSEEDTLIRPETTGENVGHSILYLVLVLCWGNNFKNIGKLFLKTYVRDSLKTYELLFRQISKQELETMRRILELKQENLAMLSGESINIDEKEKHSYGLKKVYR